jgi:hypothetical protein
MEQGVGHIALGVDHQGGDVPQGGFLQQVDAQAGLAGAGHADDDGMRGQVVGIVEQGLVDGFASLGIKNAPQVELVIGLHSGCPPH